MQPNVAAAEAVVLRLVTVAAEVSAVGLGAAEALLARLPEAHAASSTPARRAAAAAKLLLLLPLPTVARPLLLLGICCGASRLSWAALRGLLLVQPVVRNAELPQLRGCPFTFAAVGQELHPQVPRHVVPEGVQEGLNVGRVAGGGTKCWWYRPITAT